MGTTFPWPAVTGVEVVLWYLQQCDAAQTPSHAQTICFKPYSLSQEGSSLHPRTAGRRWWLGGCPVDARAVLVTVCLTPHAFFMLQNLANPLRCAISASGLPGQDVCISEQTPDGGVVVHVLAEMFVVHAELPIA